MTTFQLSKWYLDCIAGDGTAIVGYWARLRWGALALEYAAALLAPAGDQPRQSHTLRPPAPPVIAGRTCTWRCDPLQLEGQWEAAASPVELDLLDTPDGGIRWAIHQPRAQARVSVAGHVFTGLGYVERLDLSIPPWRLPFDTLRWGRFLSPDHALVWLDWDKGGADRRRFAVLNGAVCPEPAITDEGVHLPGTGDLVFLGSRRLREGHLVATVLDPIPGLVNLLPGSFRRAHESKRVSPGVLSLPGMPPSEGWSLYEVVTW